MSETEHLLELLQENFGAEIAVGDWLAIDQQRIDAFAEATGDRQWIHVDPERARRESPYGTTIAHGFLTLSLLPFLTGGNSPDYLRRHFPGMRLRVNYGLNKLRFPAPVKCGDRIRARTLLKNAVLLDRGLEVVYVFTVDIEGQDKPALVAEQLLRVYP
ncbi:MAG: MaoC family dehydratase [Deltaproteobacteria bacterium]|nr:MAG: MaoC family dehydratase [Deltaproteobacteria bacterium]